MTLTAGKTAPTGTWDISGIQEASQGRPHSHALEAFLVLDLRTRPCRVTLPLSHAR